MDSARIVGRPEPHSPVRLTDKLGNSFLFKPIQCPVCKQDHTKKVGLRGGKYQRLNLGIETIIVRCLSCGLLYPNPFPFPENPQRLYGEPDKYFEYHSISGKVTASKSLLEIIRVKTGLSCPAVLDVGSGRGELLKAAKDSGIARVVGLDFSRAMVEFARRTWGIDVRLQSIEEHAIDNAGTYDAVVLNAILEHVYRPDLMVESASKLLRKDGILYINCPNEPNLITSSYALTALARHSRGVVNLAPTFPPYHVFGFNSRSLTALLEQYGFAVESIRLHGAPFRIKPNGINEAVKIYVANALNAIANFTGTAHNMFVWARLHSGREANPTSLR